jgi:hypothetical protein
MGECYAIMPPFQTGLTDGPGARAGTDRQQSALVERSGKWWDVEPTTHNRGPDVSAMTLEWVNHTEDALFSVYTRDGSDLLRAILRGVWSGCAQIPLP